MPIFELEKAGLRRLSSVSLASAQVHERRDLQRILREQSRELLDDVLIISEEFGDWDDSRRRIDLLGVGRDANLVVIELKRGDTGVHMELQAVRYAAMVSKMTFEQAVETYARHLPGGADARAELLDFLGWVEPREDDFAQDVRIVLFSEDFSRELTSSILWLGEKGVDITCFRMRVYRLDDRLLVDFQQIIPLKEAEDYQVKVRNKQLVEQSERVARVPWNGEFYANFGVSPHRSWDDARTFGFISAGGGEWFTRTLHLLEPGARVWVNRPGFGYVGVAEVLGAPIGGSEFMVDTNAGRKRYLDVSAVGEALREQDFHPEKAELFVPVRWLSVRGASEAVREAGLFGNQNSVAKPTAASWPHTVARLKVEFGISDETDAV
ncbi:hypothetical protein [Luteimonas sp. MC1895]|uniref:hypothetical protein n=1 Tax=Luteimonas sp. MC1895 TaxID=2819513 RepID=UPI0018F10699|nr:hypothetical protein [Luteimonas sp. MC1895]MBJ6980046.1 hypothetical protein [Luteimonas sp. MC1895]